MISPTSAIAGSPLQMVPYQHDMEKYRIDIDNFVKLTRK
jgi:hypothetical protein